MSIQQPDPYWNEVGELLHFEGANGSTRIVSEKHRTPTISGAVSLSNATKVFGGSALLIADTNSGLTYPYGTWSDIAGSNFFTFECFFRLSGSKDQVIFHAVHPTSRAAGGWCIGVSAANFPYASFGSGTENLLTSSVSVSVSTWYHIAFVREETKYTLYLNGVAVATLTTANVPVGAASGAKIGQDGVNSARGFAGYIDELRVTRGYARYTTNFTPPTEPFPDYRTTTTDPHFDKVKLLCHFDGENNSTTFVDQKGHTITRSASIVVSSTQSKFGGTAAYVASSVTAGTLDVAPSTDFNLGSGPFTLEFWLRPTLDANVSGVYEIYEQARPLRTLTFAAGTTTCSFGYPHPTAGTNSYSSTYPPALATDTWVFLSFAFDGSVLRYHRNGTLVSSISAPSQTVFNSGAYGIRLFKNPSSTYAVAGYLDDFRLTLGTARYGSANYTPPTEPFPDQGIQKLTGTVLDQSGNPVARTVRSYRSSDGMYVDTAVSSAVDGGFALRATDTTEHFVVVQDATKNALVYDHIVPVI